MNTFFAIFILIFGVFGISFVLLNLRHAVTGNEFRGTCATNNPMLKSKIGECQMCGRKVDEGEPCGNPEAKA
jgi:hypothetical protein